MLFIIKMIIIGAILGVALAVIEGIIDATVKNEKTAKTLNNYVDVVGWLIIIYITIF